MRDHELENKITNIVRSSVEGVTKSNRNVTIEKLEVNVYYASGGGATVNVLPKGKVRCEH